jgi:hypothetical protein
VLAHVILVLLFRAAAPIPIVPTAAAGEDANDANAAAGGGMEMIAFRIATPPPTPPEIPKPPEPVPVPDAKPIEVPPEDPVPITSPLPGSTSSAGEGRGTKAGPGTETGTGRGDGGTGESGLNRIAPPSPRGLILPPSDRPSRVRGKTISVYVFVTDRGMVVGDSTRLNPGSGDSKFDTRLKRQAAEWVFHPAQRDGRAMRRAGQS